MITTKLGNGRVFLHNGDFSGDLEINCAPSEIERLDEYPGTDPVDRLTIPFADIKAIVATYMRRRLVIALENATDDDLLTGAWTQWLADDEEPE